MSRADLSCLELPEALAGLRLDQALPRLVPGLSRGAARALCAAHAVRDRDSGAVLAAGARVGAGRRLCLEPARLESRPGAEQAALRARVDAVRLRHLDDRWAAVSKPAGLGSGPAFWGDALHLGAAVARLVNDAWSGRDAALPDAGLVHRLDHATSGISVVARDRDTLAALVEQRRRGVLRRIYWAVVAGPADDHGVIDAPIAHHPTDPARMLVVESGAPRRGAARVARTTFVCRERGRDTALLEVQIVGGCRHQIRVHLAALGRPLVGDPLYGGRPAPRLGLHAVAVELREPGGRVARRVEDPAPDELWSLFDGARRPPA